MKKVTIYTDGSSRGNPGPGGYGTLLSCYDSLGKEHIKELSGGYAHTTNNRMELMAAIAGLEALTTPCEVDLYSDSQYLVKAFNDRWIDGWINRNWSGVKNVDLWSRLLDAMSPHVVNYIWVKGHAGHPQNERCDALATAAAAGKDLLADPGMY